MLSDPELLGDPVGTGRTGAEASGGAVDCGPEDDPAVGDELGLPLPLFRPVLEALFASAG